MAETRYVHVVARARWTRSAVFAKVFVAVLAGAPAARADWGFTHWGMTPEQVVGASGGTAHLIAPAARKRDPSGDWEVAVDGAVHDGSLTLRGGYMFDTHGGGLTCVMYNAMGGDVGKLRDSLVARLGRPRQEDEFGPVRSLTWRTPDDVELAINQTALTAAVSHCAPGH